MLFERGLVSRQRVSVGVIAPVKHALDDDARDRVGVVPLQPQRGEARVAQAGEFLVGEGRVRDDIRIEVERRVQVPRQRPHRGGGGIPPGRQGQRRAEARELIRDRGGRAGWRALVQHVGGDLRETALGVRIGRAAGLDDQVQVDHGQFTVLDHQDVQPIGQPATLHGRQRQLRIETRLWQQGEIHRLGPDRRSGRLVPG